MNLATTYFSKAILFTKWFWLCLKDNFALWYFALGHIQMVFMKILINCLIKSHLRFWLRWVTTCEFNFIKGIELRNFLLFLRSSVFHFSVLGVVSFYSCCYLIYAITPWCKKQWSAVADSKPAWMQEGVKCFKKHLDSLQEKSVLRTCRSNARKWS